MRNAAAKIGRIAMCAAAVLLLVAPRSPAAGNPPEAPAVILIQNATILTVSHGAIEHGSILIKDGKIAEVGQSIKTPKDAQVIDAADRKSTRLNSSHPSISYAVFCL